MREARHSTYKQSTSKKGEIGEYGTPASSHERRALAEISLQLEIQRLRTHFCSAEVVGRGRLPKQSLSLASPNAAHSP